MVTVFSPTSKSVFPDTAVTVAFAFVGFAETAILVTSFATLAV